jgi:ATP-dependent RNA helicase DOB1
MVNTNDLFSFLDKAPTEDGNGYREDAMQTDSIETENKPTQKRKASQPPSPRISESMDGLNDEPGPSTPKKPRTSKPIVVDEFETEAKREVPASAGLSGNVDAGTRLELKHQV